MNSISFNPAASSRRAGHVPWGLFLRSKQAWLLCGQYFCVSYGWYFYITWLPAYFKEGRGVTLAEGAALSILPLFLGGVGSFVCGWLYYPVFAMISMGMASFSNDLVMPGSWGACMDVGGKYPLREP